MAGQFGAGKASVPTSGQGSGRTAPMAGQYGQGKASVPTPTAYQPVTRSEATPDFTPAGGYPGYSSGSGSRAGGGESPPASGWSRRTMALLSGLGVLIVVLLVVVLIRVNSDDAPDPTAAGGVATTAATAAPKTRSTTKRAAPPPAPTHETTQPTPEQTQDGDDNDQGADAEAISGDNGNLCVEMPKNAAPLDKAKIKDCNGQDSQHWTYTSWFGLQQGDLCLDMGPDNEKPGENRTRVFPCNQTNTQQFKQNADGKVFNPGTGLCLTVGDDDEGAGMGMVACDGAQAWHLPQRQN